jgi:hypothetical protein
MNRSGWSILRKDVAVDLGAPEVEMGRWQRRGI